MTEDELKEIFSFSKAAIIAPAGHGKTEMIAEMAHHSPGTQLILTHTNAGVDALRKRMTKRHVPKERYHICTIAAFCAKWNFSFPNTAHVNAKLSPLGNSQEKEAYYKQLYPASQKIFQHKWAGHILQRSYSGVIVDEYQDCTISQHNVILALGEYLPIIVLGDPLQGIFDFTEPLVNWDTLDFPVFPIVTRPWRWAKTNPKLGTYLTALREQLLPSLNGNHCRISIPPIDNSIELIKGKDFEGYSLLNKCRNYRSTVFITQWENQQLDFSRYMQGIFQNDEPQDCEDLFKYAIQFDNDVGPRLAYDALRFSGRCATAVLKDLHSYLKNLELNRLDFSRIKKFPMFKQLIPEKSAHITSETVLQILTWVSETPDFKKYRMELLVEMIRGLKYSIDHGISVYNAVNLIRNDVSLQNTHSQFKFLSSRTLLSKGLEFDCVIIDMRIPLSAKNFYVAMTRAMKKIFIISDSETFDFPPSH